MSAGAAVEPRRKVEAVLRASERGDWRPALRLDLLLPPSGGRWLGWAGILVLVGRAMCARANGRPAEAWAHLDEAARHLPIAMREYRPDGVVLARLVPADGTDDPLVRRVSALVWREQQELSAFRGRLGTCARVRDQVAEAIIEYLCLVEHNRFTWHCRRPHPDEPAVDRTRKPVLDRATRSRQFADPTAGDVSQSVWQDNRGYVGLCARALDRLAEWPGPNPWCAEPGAADVPVHLGCRTAWEFARS